MIATLDDHELADGAWAGGSTEHDPEAHGPWAERRHAALRARWEWLPARPPNPDDPTRVFRAVNLGGLGDIALLDIRSRRDEPVREPAMSEPGRTMLGAEQRDWLLRELEDSQSAWRIVATPSVFTRTWCDARDEPLHTALAKLKLIDEDGAGPDHDQWDGYPAERARLTGHLRDRAIEDVVFLSADIHVSVAAVVDDVASGQAVATTVVGGHLDSVGGGPGINDNGSGTGTILEIAEEIAERDVQPRNRIRFAFWGAEEAGLVGSIAYMQDLVASGEIKKIEANLNFDMLASPNFVRFVYDGDNSTGEGVKGPNGSDTIEQVFLDYFQSQGLATEPTAFDGRSDYGEFIANGVPAGGLFSGAEGIKTAAEATTYGGVAGVWYDPCYHQACDTLGTVLGRPPADADGMLGKDPALLPPATASSVSASSQTEPRTPPGRSPIRPAPTCPRCTAPPAPRSARPVRRRARQTSCAPSGSRTAGRS